MTIERKDCPICRYAMNYMFPAPRLDKAVDAVLDRFQQCDASHLIPKAKHPMYQVDVTTNQRYAVTRKGDSLTVDGVTYDEVGQWVRTLGIVAEPRRGDSDAGGGAR